MTPSVQPASTSDCRACCVTHGALGFAVDPRDVHTASPQLDEEEHIQPLQPHCLDGEEIDGKHPSAVRAYELAPGHPPARAGRSETRCLPRAYAADLRQAFLLGCHDALLPATSSGFRPRPTTSCSSWWPS